MLTSETIAAELLQSVNRNASGQQPPGVGVRDLLELIADDLDDVGRGDAAEHVDHVVHDGVEREEAGQRDQRQQGWKQREEEVVRLLSGEVEHIVGDRLH